VPIPSPTSFLTGERRATSWLLRFRRGRCERGRVRDVIVGAYGNDAGGSMAGRAYVHFGAAAADTVPDLVLTGRAESDYFGYSVSGAGDVNGDGFADALVGAYRSDAGGPDAGCAYVYYGGRGRTPSPTSFGPAKRNRTTSAGPCRRRGCERGRFGDVIVGAYGNDAAGLDAGARTCSMGVRESMPFPTWF